METQVKILLFFHLASAAMLDIVYNLLLIINLQNSMLALLKARFSTKKAGQAPISFLRNASKNRIGGRFGVISVVSGLGEPEARLDSGRR